MKNIHILKLIWIIGVIGLSILTLFQIYQTIIHWH
jgi:hypothetical protein